MKNITAFYLVVLSCSLLTSACGTQCMSQTRASDVQQLEAKPKKLSIVNKLKENGHLPVAERIALYNKLKKENAKLYDFENETELTLYGYSFLYENNLVDALTIFELIIVVFPNSANAYDSKGEAYLAAKDSANAIKYYSKSLEMDPDNFHAEDVIESIQHPHIKPLTSQEKFSKIYSKEDYQSDLNQLGQKLLAVHPHPLKFISKGQFWKLYKCYFI